MEEREAQIISSIIATKP